MRLLGIGGVIVGIWVSLQTLACYNDLRSYGTHAHTSGCLQQHPGASELPKLVAHLADEDLFCGAATQRHADARAQLLHGVQKVLVGEVLCESEGGGATWHDADLEQGVAVLCEPTHHLHAPHQCCTADVLRHNLSYFAKLPRQEQASATHARGLQD